MSVIWTEVTPDVLDMANNIILKYHTDLLDAKIGFVFRSEAQASNGRVILGQASKVSEKMKVHLDFDFIIWLSEDDWKTLSFKQKQALLDHELCHCSMPIAGEAKMRRHDIEEFECIIERYGLWSLSLIKAKSALSKAIEAEQLGLPLEINVQHLGSVAAIRPDQASILT